MGLGIVEEAAELLGRIVGLLGRIGELGLVGVGIFRFANGL